MLTKKELDAYRYIAPFEMSKDISELIQHIDDLQQEIDKLREHMAEIIRYSWNKD